MLRQGNRVGVLGRAHLVQLSASADLQERARGQHPDGVGISRHAAVVRRAPARRSPRAVRHGPHPHQDAVAEGGGGGPVQAHRPVGTEDDERAWASSRTSSISRRPKKTARCSNSTSTPSCSAVPWPARPAFRRSGWRSCARRSRTPCAIRNSWPTRRKPISISTPPPTSRWQQLLAQFADYPKSVIERAKLAITR